MALVRRFFCFELLTTGLLIGWLGLAESLSSCISSILMLENIDTIFTPDKFPDMDMKALRPIIINIVGTNIALNIMDLLASGLLITGTVKRNRLLLLPWLINTGISLLFGIIAATVVIIFVFTSTKIETAAVFPLLVIGVIVIGFYVYMWVAIYSLYDFIRRNQPNNEYSRLIEDSHASGSPIYTRA